MNIWNFEIRSAILIFFFLENYYLTILKSYSSRSRNLSLRSQKLTLDFLKIPEGTKMDQKLLKYFFGLWSRNLVYDLVQMIDTNFFQWATLIFFKMLQTTHFISKVSFSRIPSKVFILTAVQQIVTNRFTYYVINKKVY